MKHLHNLLGQIMQLMQLMYAIAMHTLSNDHMIRLYNVHVLHTPLCRPVSHYGAAAFRWVLAFPLLVVLEVNVSR